MEDIPNIDLTGRLLIAMPAMGDPRFARSVIFVCDHSQDGAMGLIVNKPAPDLTFSDLLGQLGISAARPVTGVPIHVGGPVEHGRGFVLHSADYDVDGSTLVVNDRYGMTATLEVLEDIALGRGPKQSLLALGYSGWGPGQLEGELLQNGWLICDAQDELLFDSDNKTKWERALATLGVDPLNLSATAGHA